MSHRTPSKTEFDDEFREDASCRAAVKEDPSLATAWDNIDAGTWEKNHYIPDPQANVARNLCFSCPVRTDCLLDALSDNEAEGIRAGYRFERGYVTKNDARKIYGEFNKRAKVRKTSKKPYVQTPEVPEMRKND